MKVFSSWSGGKDCALATYKAILQGHEVLCLLNFLSEDGERSRSHGVKAEALASQAKAIGIPIIQVKTSWDEYEENFKKAAGRLKDEGIEGGVFGDIELEGHREWVEKVCREIRITPILPLWGMKPEEVIDEILGLGFEALIIATKLDEGFLGKVLDKSLTNRIKRLGFDPCGENGEYHTFVTRGPIFKKQIKVTKGERRKRDNVWFLEVFVEVEG